MSDNKDLVPSPEAKMVNIIRSSEFKDIYSNNPRVSFSQFDMTIAFARTSETAQNTMVIEDLAHVRLSPQGLKNLTYTLIASYETATRASWRASCSWIFSLDTSSTNTDAKHSSSYPPTAALIVPYADPPFSSWVDGMSTR